MADSTQEQEALDPRPADFELEAVAPDRPIDDVAQPAAAPTQHGRSRTVFILEFVGIVFSVLLALALDQWRENYVEDKRRDKALLAIQSELESNRQGLADAMKYWSFHQPEVERAVDVLFNDKNWTFKPKDGFIGMRPFRLTRAAYDAAQAAGLLTRVDLETARHLAHAYRDLQNLDEQGQNYGLSMSSVRHRDGLGYLSIMNFSMESFILTSKRLEPVLDETIAQLKRKKL